MAPRYFHLQHWRLWYWIRGWKTHPPSTTIPSGTLNHNHRLRGDQICGSGLWLDIQYQALPEQVPFSHEILYWFFLLKYGHAKPTNPRLALHNYRDIKYGDKQQIIPEENNISDIDVAGVKIIKAIIGELLHYARAVNNKLLVALIDIGAQQATDTKANADSIKKLLYYVATYPNDGIYYRASDIVLDAHSDTRFHNESNGSSCEGAHIFFIWEWP